MEMMKIQKHLLFIIFAILCIGAAYILGKADQHFYAKLLLAIAVVCLIAGVVLYYKIRKVVESHKGVKILYQMEAPGVWSSHITGRELYAFILKLWKLLLRHCIKWRLMAKKSEVYKPILLFTDKDDRKTVNKLSLRAFETMLDRLANEPGATIISASVLNFKGSRLEERIRAVESRPGWTYLRVNRTLPRLDTLFGRWMYGWPMKSGESSRAIMLGIIAWRVQDSAPELKKFELQSSMSNDPTHENKST